MDLTSILDEWFEDVGDVHMPVSGIAVFGPSATGRIEDREVYLSYPEVFSTGAASLCQSPEYGLAWRQSGSPVSARRTLASSSTDESNSWAKQLSSLGIRSFIHVSVDLPLGRAYELFAFSEIEATQELTLPVANELQNLWRQTGKSICWAKNLTRQERRLTELEAQTLRMTADGMTAAEIAAAISRSSRTVEQRLLDIGEKMGTNNKLSAVQRAMFLGLL